MQNMVLSLAVEVLCEILTNRDFNKNDLKEIFESLWRVLEHCNGAHYVLREQAKGVASLF